MMNNYLGFPKIDKAINHLYKFLDYCILSDKELRAQMIESKIKHYFLIEKGKGKE